MVFMLHEHATQPCKVKKLIMQFWPRGTEGAGIENNLIAVDCLFFKLIPRYSLPLFSIPLTATVHNSTRSSASFFPPRSVDSSNEHKLLSKQSARVSLRKLKNLSRPWDVKNSILVVLEVQNVKPRLMAEEKVLLESPVMLQACTESDCAFESLKFNTRKLSWKMFQIPVDGEDSSLIFAAYQGGGLYQVPRGFDENISGVKQEFWAFFLFSSGYFMTAIFKKDCKLWVELAGL